MTAVALRNDLTPDQHRSIERARMGGALRRICISHGLGAAVSDAQAELRALAEEVRRSGGDTEGWIG